ncbi:MAG: hypothetical protein IT310_01785 [Anaerolineales bacterium]|nr:hypothetical protein [Anaerolineales bacterium]
MEDKMARVDAEDEAEWNRVESVLDLRAVLAAQARQDGQNQYMDDKMSAIDAADELKWHDDAPPWWKIWDEDWTLSDAKENIKNDWDNLANWTDKNIFETVNQKWKDAKKEININAVQPIKNVYNRVTAYINALPPSLPDKIYAVVRDVAIYTIPPIAEFLHAHIYRLVLSFTEAHPYITKKVTQAINFVLNRIAKPMLSRIVDINPATMNWADLGMAWLFELGEQKKLVFDADSKLTQNLMQHDVVQNVREAAITKITEGRLEDVVEDCLSPIHPTPAGQYPVCMPSQYGVSKYFQSLGQAFEGDLSHVFLGSYVVTINVEPKGNGLYAFHYQITNPSTWESATRFRIDSTADSDTINEAIIPDVSPRGEGIRLGGLLEQTFEWSEEIYIPAEGTK